jgi:hypothetical protein
MDLAIVPRFHRPQHAEVAADPLRDRFAKHVEESVLGMLDPDRIEAMAEDMRLVRRHRVLHAGLVIDAMVLSALERGADAEGRLLDARQTYRQIGGLPSNKNSFREMVHKLVPVMGKMLKRRMKEISSLVGCPELEGRLAGFSDVLMPDGCAFKLAAALSGAYAGTSQAAELKLHAVYSLRAQHAVSVEMSAGRVHDSDCFWPEWERNALYVWDLGYNNYGRFIDAVQEGGAHVLQRLKVGANPRAIASYGPTGHPRLLVDEDGKYLSLDEACQFVVHRQRVLDLDVEIRDKQGRRMLARVVCVPCDGEDRYYLTSLPREIFTPHDVAEMYRLRWEVELFFKNWKGSVRMDQVRYLSHPLSLQAAIFASMLAALLAHDIYMGLQKITIEHHAAEQTAARPVPPSATAVRAPFTP